jgi:hypothetical protein
MNTLESNIKSILRLDNLLRLFIDFVEAKGINTIEAMAKRYVAITKGGASAKRIKIAANEIDSTPTKRIIYGFILISFLNGLSALT